MILGIIFFFQAEDGIRELVRSRGLGDVYKRQVEHRGPLIDDANLRARPLRMPEVQQPIPQRKIEESLTQVLDLAFDAFPGRGARRDSLRELVTVSPGHATRGEQVRTGLTPVSSTHLTRPTNDLYKLSG